MTRINMVEAIRNLKGIKIASAVDEYMTYLSGNFEILEYQARVLEDTATSVKSKCVKAAPVTDVPIEWLRNIGIVK